MVAARRLGSSPGGALAAGAFAALAPYHVYYSQEGRAYALLALLLVWSWAAQQPGGLQPAEMALVVSMSGGALLANLVSVVLMISEIITARR